jgi:hypothetical protein
MIALFIALIAPSFVRKILQPCLSARAGEQLHCAGSIHDYSKTVSWGTRSKMPRALLLRRLSAKA